MINNKKIIAIIPARKGSKRIKNKNLLKINGIPLISFSINYAKKSKLIDKIENYLYITNLIKTNIPRKYKLCIPLKK